MNGARVTVFSRHYAEYCYRYALALSENCRVQLILDIDNVRDQFGSTELRSRDNLSIKMFRLRLKGTGLFHAVRATLATLRFRPHVVHFQEIPDVLHPIIQRTVSPFARTALTVHDPNPHSGSDSGLPSSVYRLQQRARESADLLIVHGSRCHADLCNRMPHRVERIIESTHGILMEPTTEAARSITKDPRMILCFGRMEHYKGIGVLAQAAKIMTDRGIDYRLVMAGRGPELDKYQAELESLPQVSVLNRWISAEEASELYLRAGTIAMPYLNATQSGVAAAAVANRCAIVASCIGGLPDVVTDDVNGLLVEPGDAEGLAAALSRIVTERDLGDRLREGAAEAASVRLNWSRIARDLAPHFFQLADRPRSSSKSKTTQS